MTTTPVITDENEMVVEFYGDGPDSFNRRNFFAFWLDNNIGYRCNEHGVRGQAFFTDADEFIARNQTRGRTVRVTQRDETAEPTLFPAA